VKGYYDPTMDSADAALNRRPSARYEPFPAEVSVCLLTASADSPASGPRVRRASPGRVRQAVRAQAVRESLREAVRKPVREAVSIARQQLRAPVAHSPAGVCPRPRQYAGLAIVPHSLFIVQ
jgi:hypothetical protein